LQRAIEFVAVDFGYDASTLVLNNISLTIKQGQMTALVGSSGAGKTTLADLLPRFYDPTQGKILIDGVDLRELEINSLRRKLAVVSQDTFIFNTSVRDNIAYHRRVDEAAIWEAARLANALDLSKIYLMVLKPNWEAGSPAIWRSTSAYSDRSCLAT